MVGVRQNEEALAGQITGGAQSLCSLWCYQVLTCTKQIRINIWLHLKSHRKHCEMISRPYLEVKEFSFGLKPRPPWRSGPADWSYRQTKAINSMFNCNCLVGDVLGCTLLSSECNNSSLMHHLNQIVKVICHKNDSRCFPPGSEHPSTPQPYESLLHWSLHWGFTVKAELFYNDSCQCLAISADISLCIATTNNTKV